MNDGVININKPAGWTSQDVCTKLRHVLHIRKTGHTGTLDPMATGVLPVCIGKATRIIEYYDRDFKTYRAGMKLGAVSDTLDIWGNVTQERAVRIISGDGRDTAGSSDEDTPEGGDVMLVGEEAVRNAFARYTGEVAQIPPKYSALKINGRRAYDLARQGEEFEIKSRNITIKSNEIIAIDWENGTVEFEVVCSKGTYIRTICDDIGRELGCGAVMTSLVRTASGYFDIADAVDLEKLAEMGAEAAAGYIIPMDVTLAELGIVELDDNRFTAFINGNSSGIGFKVAEGSNFTDNSTGLPVYKVYNRGQFLGTALISGRDLVPAKVIYNR